MTAKAIVVVKWINKALPALNLAYYRRFQKVSLRKEEVQKKRLLLTYERSATRPPSLNGLRAEKTLSCRVRHRHRPLRVAENIIEDAHTGHKHSPLRVAENVIEDAHTGRSGSERFLHTPSISSMKTIQGAFSSASSNNLVMIFSASPTYLLRMLDPSREMYLKSFSMSSWANASII